MSFQFNSDKEQIRAINPQIISDSTTVFRSGTGSTEKEVARILLDPNTGLPRVGINRTGNRIDRIVINSQGSGYTLQPTVQIEAPPNGGTPALASAVINLGKVVGISIDNPGSGYETTPAVTIIGGNGQGANATAFLDTVDFELDVNGAIRTSTSIISDTARILNIDIDNLVTADLNLRAPNLKTYANSTGILWESNVNVQKNSYRYFGPNVYQSLNTGVTGLLPPTHEDGIELNGEVEFKHIGFRVDSSAQPFFQESGDSGVFPRSITPLLGDKSDKIATTEYVLNLATNDVGGRIYVSQQIGSDLNDGRSAVNPVRTIKRACQLAWETPGVKESVIISGGDYVEDNPISIPPDASIVGDNLRLVIIRPLNPRKHIFKFGDKNYVTGVTYRDQIDSNGDAIATWDYAMVFDDKQRLTFDITTNGDFGTDFPVGHQIFGPEKFRADFVTNTGLSSLTPGQRIRGVNTGAVGLLTNVNFEAITGPTAYQSGTIDFIIVGGSFTSGETFQYGGTGTIPFESNKAYNLNQLVWTGDNVYRITVAGTSGTNAPSHTTGAVTDGIIEYTFVRVAYEFASTDILSTRAEGEVVFVDEDTTSGLPIVKIDFSLQGDPSIATGGFGDYGSAEDLGGIVFYTSELVGRQNFHNFKEGQEIFISGLPSSPDLSAFNGYQRIYKVIEDADGRARRFVIPKKFPGLDVSNFNPGDNAAVKSASKSVTVSLLNSPNTFPMATPVARRYQDACLQIRNNINFIADEVVGRINDEFKKEYFPVYNVSGNTFKIYLGPSRFEHTYVNGGIVNFAGNNYSITNFVYDHEVTGEATITTSAPVASLVNDSIVKLSGINVQCVIDGVITQKTYPSFNIPVSDAKCRRDVGHFLNAVLRDLEFGSNYNTIEAAKKYISSGQIDLVDYEITQTIRAIEYARELAIYAMRKWRTGNGMPADPIYTPVYSSVERYFDETVIDDIFSPACDNVRSAIDTLSYLFVDVLANNASGTYLDAAYLIARNRDFIADEAYGITKNIYPSLGLSDLNESKCRRDINFVLSGLLRDLILGGNSGVVTAAESYFTGTELTGIPEAQREETIFAFNQVRDLSILAMRNWKTGTNGTGVVYTPLQSPIPLFTDPSILEDPAANNCANVVASINTSFDLIEDILFGTIAPGATTKTFGTLFDTSSIISFPDSTIYDADGVIITPRSDYDDYPIIEASPYTQNASIISFLGGGGALVDGSRVKQPNCPFPGLEIDGSASFPNQGKSMVAAAFTIVSFGGTGYKIINDGYVQLVSVFVIFCADGILAESGGYASVTNSATNFGIYALRAIGYREEAYVFDVGVITNAASTPTGRTIFTVDGLGREPLEHYIVKIDGYENVNTEIEYFVDVITGVGEGPPFSAQLTLSDNQGVSAAEFKSIATGQVVSNVSLIGETLKLHRPSIVNSSSHTWEFAGSGTNYNALPENGGVKIESNEQVPENYGRVYCSGTDELGDFKVGTFAKIENRTGNITFTGTVTISEVEFLKLKGGDVVVTGFDASNTLGGAATSNSKLPTQKAVRDFITNNLGPYINKPYSTNAVPRALVELTDSGKINIDQIPALRPFSVFTVANEEERLTIEGALAGDIAIQQDTSASYILNNDNGSVFLGITTDPTLQFTFNDIFTGSISGGKIQATEYRQGVVYQLTLTEPGSGYTTAPTVTISGGSPQAGSVEARAVATVANGEVVTISLILYNGFIGGKGYSSTPTVTIAGPTTAGTTAEATAFIESRVYGNIINNIKILDTDNIQSSDIPAETIAVNRVVNTSASNLNNWVSLSTTQISADNITEGTLSVERLANNSAAANSFTFLRGDQSFQPTVQSIKGAETRYFAKLSVNGNGGSSSIIFPFNSNILVGHTIKNNVAGIQENTNVTGVVSGSGITTVSLNNALTQTIPAGTVIQFERGSSPIVLDSTYTQGAFVEEIVITNGGQNYTNGVYFNVPLTGGTGLGLTSNLTVENGAVVNVVVTSGGSGYDTDFNITSSPTEIGGGSNLVLSAKIATVNRQYASVSVDISRAGGIESTLSTDEFGTVGVVRLKKSQFGVGANGAVTLYTGPDSGLNADLLDNQQGSYYTNATNLNAGTVSTDRLSGTYNISIFGQSGNTLRLISGITNVSSNPTPDSFSVGVVADSRTNNSNGLSDGGTKNFILTLRGNGSGLTADGGVRQLAFTDNDNMWLRGSGNNVEAFGSWAKVWTSLNDGPNTGLDADKLDNRQGAWYQNALNINYNILSDNRIPVFQSKKAFQNNIKILAYTGNPRYKIYIVDEVLTASPFLVGQSVNLYDDQGVGTGGIISITNVETNSDPVDSKNNYTIITGTLTQGNFINATQIGTAAVRKEFVDFSLATVDSNSDGIPDGMHTVATLENDGGTANLRLGRADGTASSPGIYFRTSQLAAPNYNVALLSSGGSDVDSSGSLEIKVLDNNSLTVNGNKIWNEGNIAFATTNTANTAVLRDASGNFAAGTITASLTGAASLNVLRGGDTMTGSLTLSGTTSNLSVGGTLGVTGNSTFTGNLTTDGIITVAKDGVGLILQPDTSGSYSLVEFRSRANASSDKGFILVQDESATAPGTSTEDLRMTIGVYNDFRQSNAHSEELWLQGGGRQVFNVGSWDTELNTIIGTPGVGTSFGGPQYEWRVNNSVVMTMLANGNLGVADTNPTSKFSVNGTAFVKTSLTIRDNSDNNGAPIYFLGSNNQRNFRIGNQLSTNDVFEITPSTAGGGTTWATTPALAIQGSTGRVGIGTTTFSSTATGATVNYRLNVNGNLNVNGIIYQNNQPFVTSNWTKSGNDIYRSSKVSIGTSTIDKTLTVGGDIGMTGILYVNNNPLWIDANAVIRTFAQNVSANTTIPASTNAISYGPVNINTGVTITVSSGSTWNIL